jgi:hypothetical protein
MTFTLNDFADLLDRNEQPGMRTLKEVLLRDRRPAGVDTLTLDNALEVAHFLALMALVACLSNEKDSLKALKNTLADAELLGEYELFEQRLTLQSFTRIKNGMLKLGEDNLPTAELDAKKLALLLRSSSQVFTEAAKLSLAELATSKGFLDAFSSRVSHPTKLSAPRGAGGFFKNTSAVCDNPASVTEEDFATRETATLACNAAYQKMWALLLPLVAYQGQTMRLVSLLIALPDLTESVRQILIDSGMTQGSVLLDAMVEPFTACIEGEPQVFCGDLPHTERVSVLAPYGLFSEMDRARRAVAAAYDKDRDDKLGIYAEELADKEAELAALGIGATTREKKRTLSDEIKRLKADRKSLSATWLPIPCFTLQFGGANPRNLAMDLDTTLHTANVRVYVPNQRKPVAEIGNKAFISSALIAMPDLPRFDKVPRCLLPQAIGAVLARQRRTLFAELTAQAMAPLKALQEEWRTRSKVFAGDVALAASAEEEIRFADDAWSFFIKGDEKVNVTDAERRLRPLVDGIAKAVKTVLKRACDGQLSDVYDTELVETVAGVVALERT